MTGKIKFTDKNHILSEREAFAAPYVPGAEALQISKESHSGFIGFGVFQRLRHSRVGRQRVKLGNCGKAQIAVVDELKHVGAVEDRVARFGFACRKFADIIFFAFCQYSYLHL